MKRIYQLRRKHSPKASLLLSDFFEPQIEQAEQDDQIIDHNKGILGVEIKEGSSPELNQACADHDEVDDQHDLEGEGKFVEGADNEHHGQDGIKIVVVPAKRREKGNHDEQEGAFENFRPL